MDGTVQCLRETGAWNYVTKQRNNRTIKRNSKKTKIKLIASSQRLALGCLRFFCLEYKYENCKQVITKNVKEILILRYLTIVGENELGVYENLRSYADAVLSSPATQKTMQS